MIMSVDVNFSGMIAVRARGFLREVSFVRHRVICFRDGGGCTSFLKNYTLIQMFFIFL